jgi:hypothetical protein
MIDPLRDVISGCFPYLFYYRERNGAWCKKLKDDHAVDAVYEYRDMKV